MPTEDPDDSNADEARRLAALHRYQILDTAREPEFDDIVTVAAQLCGAPMALISLVDDKRQWFKAAIGVAAAETPREIAFCAHAIEQENVFLVPDAARDPRFARNPLVVEEPRLRFYAGAPLQTAEGLALGTLCVLDSRPRTLTEQQQTALQALARQVMRQLELRLSLATQRTEEERRRLILESAVDYAIISIDLKGVVTSWNEGARRIFGWTEAEMCGRRCDDFFTLQDRENGVPEREMGAALTRGRGTDERWHLRKDGTLFWASGEMMPLCDDDGVPVGLIKILRDRTLVRQAEERAATFLELTDRLRDVDDIGELAFISAETLGRALGLNRAGFATVAADGDTVAIDREWIQPGIASSKGLHRLSDFGSFAHDLQNGNVVIVDDMTRDVRVNRPALEALRARSFVYVPMLDDGLLVAYLFVSRAAPYEWTRTEVAFIREVAERTGLAIGRRAAESELRALAASLEHQVEARVRERNRLWSSTSDLMGTVSLDGQIAKINPAWARLLGEEAEAVDPRDFVGMFNPGDREKAARMIDGLRSGGDVADFVGRIDSGAGVRSVMWNGVRDDGVFYLVGRDVTSLRDAEERLRQSQKMDAIGQLTGGIAHDFNNLLAGITGAIDVIRLRLKAGKPEGLERFLNAASTSARRAAALTHRLLAFSRLQPLDPVSTDVNQLVTEMAELLRRTLGENIDLETILRTSVWRAVTDSNQLENAILNLAINARDAMPDGGRLVIETENTQLDAAYAAANVEVSPGDYVVVSVTDTGTGMPPDVVAKAFDPFFTTKPIGQGTGLGLSMIYGFSKQIGGHARIFSEVGRGTTVKLYLRRGTVETAPDRPVESGTVERSQGENVLVVEDDPTVRLLIVEVLSELGYTYVEAPDARAALPVLKSDLRIDLLVTDVGLPHLNGRQLAEIARSERPDLKVLFITGYAQNAAIRGGFLAEGMDMLTKPFPLNAFASKVREMLGNTTND